MLIKRARKSLKKMSTFSSIATLCAIASLVVTALTVSACMLSSRVSREENLTEQYDELIQGHTAPSHSYSVNN